MAKVKAERVVDNSSRKIRACGCQHDYQDQRYGQGKRVCNRTAGKQNVQFRCTVCGKVA